MQLKGKKILLGICGSIAAYKSAFLTRLLVKQGAEVRVIMTQAATHFITPLTLSTLSKNPVVTQFFTSQEQLWNNHVELGLWADLLLVAPVSGSTLAKMANGLCDNVLVATYLSARCPVFFAPAMDLDMWLHPSTQRNVVSLQAAGNVLVPVGTGELASGLVGKGRMAEPESIVQQLVTHFAHETPNLSNSEKNTLLLGQRVLITAGPTYEPIDPVRFIGNRSSGKMGVELADAAQKMGAKVTLILGPSHLRPQSPHIEVVQVKTAQEMFEATVPRFKQNCTIAILAAAVSDYTPKEVSRNKIKKKGEQGLTLQLTKTKDILAHLGSLKQNHQLLVGFALETNNEVENAKKKLLKKNLDFIVLNSLKDKGAGFKHNTNKISILDKHNNIKKFELKSKAAVAIDILNKALAMMS
ncbi:MAG: bifunctional phosphopantothenoylcysteine decarboxylase/phosphopantothenate--cysteine ligase CoaBC [Chitinophagales bacterium]